MGAKAPIVTRLFSTIEVKSVDDEKRILVGMATTPSTDRMDDIVEPKGAVIKLPLPFLFHHDRYSPIGHITKAVVKATGIEITVELVKPYAGAPQSWTDRLDTAWADIKTGLVRGLSIGFSPIETAQIENSWGRHYLKWEFLECSAVTIPANQDCSVTSIKSIASRELAASGPKTLPVVLLKNSAGVAAKTSTKTPPENIMKLNYQDEIKKFQATRDEKQDRFDEIMKATGDAGRTPDASEDEELKTLESELKALDTHLVRLKSAEAQSVSRAKAVVVSSPDGRTVEIPGSISVTAKRAPMKDGLALAQMVKCIGMAQGNLFGAQQVAMQKGDMIDERVIGMLKTAVAAGTTDSTTWVQNLVGAETSIYADFIAYLRPMTIIGRFGANGIPSLHNVPFRTALVGQTSAGSGYWVGENKPKPLTKFDFSRTSLTPLKVANIAVLSEEAIRDSSPKADVLVRDALVAALGDRLDTDFINPSKAAVAGISPASILNGVAGIASSGTDADAVRHDIKAVFTSFINGNNTPVNGVWIMPSTTALALSLMLNPLGQPEFPGITLNGGTFQGLPVITSQYLAAHSDGATVALVNASDIYFADEGGFAVDMSKEASLQFSDSPDSPVSASTVMVNLWQHNLVGFRAERTVNWARRRATGVAWLNNVNWGA